MKKLRSITTKLGHTKSYDFTCQTISDKVDGTLSKKPAGSHGFGYRHLVAFWCFFYFAMINCHVTVVSVAIVAMVNHTGVTRMHQTNTSVVSCPLPATAVNASADIRTDGPFSWDSQTQGQIIGLSSFGYIASNFFAGRIAEILGAKRVILAADFFVNVCTLISPFAATWSVYALIVFQIARGFFQGFIVPCLFVVMANWFPRSERGLLSSFAACGTSFGALVTVLGVGKLCDSPALGWKSAFWLTGGFNLVASLIYKFVFYEVPKHDPRISKEELQHITGDQENDMSKKRPPAPWKAIFTSIPVHALSIGKFGYYWSMAHFLCMHPTFMGTVLHFSMTQNGLSSALLFLCMLAGAIISMTANNCLQRRKVFGVNTLRKGCSLISALGFSVCLLGVRLAECDTTINMVFCALAVLFGGFGMCGTMIANGDMSPTFSGSLSGFTSSTSCLAMILMPIITGALTTHETLEEWHVVFYMHITIVLICALIFQLFGSADVQPWDSVRSPETQAERKPQTEPTKTASSPTSVHM